MNPPIVAVDTPAAAAAVLSRMLGIHISVAVLWHVPVGGDWNGYAADVVEPIGPDWWLTGHAGIQ